MNYFVATLYGVVQGITEFLPVSSSAHLALLPKILGIPEPGVHFDFAMHIGTFLALLVYFRKTIVDELSQLLKTKKISPLLQKIVVTTSISVLFIFLLKDFAESYRSPLLIAFNLAFAGVFLILSERVSKKIAHLNFTGAGIFGFFQALALFPGVSRSGATITTGRFLGLSKKDAAQYSFLASLPIMLAGTLYELKNFYSFSHASFSLPVMGWGMLISFLAGYAALQLFTLFVEKISFTYYGLYRIALAIIIILVLAR